MQSRVLIVDDHVGFRGEARTLLESAGYEVVGEAATASAATAAAASLQPDLVILDIGLPDGSGLDATAEIRAAAPRTAVVLVSVRPATRARRVRRSSTTPPTRSMSWSSSPPGAGAA